MNFSTFSIAYETCTLMNSSIETDLLANAIEAIPENQIQRIKILDLSNASLLEHLPKNLSRFSDLESLRLNNCHQLRDLSGIRECKTTRLTEIVATRCFSLKDISAIGAFSIRKLDISYCPSIAGFQPLLSQAQSLQELNLSGLSVFTDISRFITEMNKFKHLHKLQIGDSSISRSITPDQFKRFQCAEVIL